MTLITVDLSDKANEIVEIFKAKNKTINNKSDSVETIILEFGKLKKI